MIEECKEIFKATITQYALDKAAHAEAHPEQKKKREDANKSTISKGTKKSKKRAAAEESESADEKDAVLDKTEREIVAMELLIMNDEQKKLNELIKKQQASHRERSKKLIKICNGEVSADELASTYAAYVKQDEAPAPAAAEVVVAAE